MVLAYYLEKYGYSIDSIDLENLTLEVSENNFDVTEIASKLSKLIK